MRQRQETANSSPRPVGFAIQQERSGALSPLKQLSNKSLQQSALVMRILGWAMITLPLALPLYPPGFLWGSHPADFPTVIPHPASHLYGLHPYLFMIIALYVAWGILMVRGAKDPKANAALFDYGILGKVLLGLVMLVAAFVYPDEITYLWADVPLAFALPVILSIYHPNRVAPETSPASAEPYDGQPLEAARNARWREGNWAIGGRPQ